MGNVRQTYIKRVAIDLVKKYNDQFSDDFEHNKQAVSNLTDVKSNVLRNRIAGYLTTYRKAWESATVAADDLDESADVPQAEEDAADVASEDPVDLDLTAPSPEAAAA